MSKSILFSAILCMSTVLLGQNVGIGTSTPDASAKLDITSTTSGILIPRMTDAQKMAIPSPAAGLLIYQTDGTAGFYYYNGSAWVPISGSSGWGLTGNASTVDGTNFLGTTDDVPMNFRVNNQKAGRIGNSTEENVFLGYQAGLNNAPAGALFGQYNTGIGYQSLYSNTTGNENTANGAQALYSNTTGFENTANGAQALYSNTTGYRNTANGFYALYFNTTGAYNTANGAQALYSNTTGYRNTANGIEALYSNTTGYENTANGTAALYSNTTGSNNTANGFAALYSNATGSNNTANGAYALRYNTTGYENTANGSYALYSNTTGNENTANGDQALYNNTTGSSNIAIGYRSGFGSFVVNFNECTFVGASSSPTVNRTNVTMLGYGIANAQCTGDNQVLLGNTAITQIRAQVTSISAYSDARFKSNIQDNVKGLDFIMRLKPVTYNTNPEILHQIWGTPDSLVKNIDHSEIKQQRFIGFLAQDVDKAAQESGFDFPGIDRPRNEKEVYSLRYVDFIMPMVKAMQEQQAQIEALKKENEELRKKIERLEKHLKLTE